MASRKATIVVDAGLATAYNSVPQSRQKAARKAMQLVLSNALRQEEKQERSKKQIRQSLKIRSAWLSKKESELMTRINRGLTPDNQVRYLELREKRENETLTSKEEYELSQIIESLEDIWADRLEALLKLARLRKMTPQQLMNQLQIEPYSNGQ